MKVESNIWKIFYNLLILSFVSLFILLYFVYININDRHESELQHYTEIISKTVSSTFSQKNLILNILGEQLLINDNYKDKKKSKKILDSLLSKSKYIIVFSLADTKGNLIAASSNINTNNKTNILNNKNSIVTFNKALHSSKTVIGRTIYFKELNKWIIPIRKAIRDNNGVVVAVMTAGLINEKDSNYFDDLKLSKEYTVEIVKDYDTNNEMYTQYSNKDKTIALKDLYGTAISEEIIFRVETTIKNKYGYSFSQLRKNHKTVSLDIVNSLGNEQIIGLVYDEKYNLWVLVQSSRNIVYIEFVKILLIVILLFISVLSLIYWLFKKISMADIEKKKELIYQAQHDILTNLPNRKYMYENVDPWIEKHKNKYDVLYIDLDNFKNINDKFGHTIGDEILIEVAKRLRLFFNSDDMLIRQGGDEFIVLKECLNENKVEANFIRLINTISEVYYIKNKEFRIGMSVGIAQYPHDAQNIEELLSLADTAMYEAKKIKNSYCFFSEKLRHISVMKTDIEQELRGAIEKDELWMVYQPQINSDGTIYGVEALVRWQNAKLGFVGPDKFIAVAEESGLMRELGEFIIRTSLREINKIKKDLDVDFSLSINISVIQIMESDFLSNILEFIEYENFDKFMLTLEITESLSIEDLDEVLPILHSIRKEGIEISLDDFGTGYSSLSVLKELPVNELKIDKSFVDEILYDESEKVLVQSIINIGKNFGMKTLAEGVESIEQVEILRDAKCDIFQGYYYSKPLLKDDLVKFLNKKYEDKI